MISHDIISHSYAFHDNMHNQNRTGVLFWLVLVHLQGRAVRPDPNPLTVEK
jgi:hypothetical protein